MSTETRWLADASGVSGAAEGNMYILVVRINVRKNKTYLPWHQVQPGHLKTQAMKQLPGSVQAR